MNPTAMRRFAGWIRKSGLLVLGLLIMVVSQGARRRSAADITLSTVIGWRYVPFLLTSLTDVGTVGVRWYDIGRAMEMLPFEKFLFRVVIADWLPVKARGVFLREAQWGAELKTNRTVELIGSYYQDSTKGKAGSFVLPYFGHPAYYSNSYDKLSKRLAIENRPKKHLLFFSGSSSPFYERLISDFALNNRHELLSWLTEYLDKPSSIDLKRKSRIRIIGDSRDSLSKQALSQKDYVHALSESDFCLCLPGWKIPHSHSIVESLLTGCIPITNYPHLMYPQLEHGKNCLSFDSITMLQSTLEGLPLISKEDKEEMRGHVFDYAARYLETFAVGSKLLAALEQGASVVSYNDESGC